MARLFSFRIGPAPSMASCFAAKRGLRGLCWIQERTVVLCHRAKGDPHEGHLRPEMVSLVPPAPRRGIIPETRSVSYLLRRPQSAFLFLQFESNFILLRREVGNDLPQLIQRCGAFAESTASGCFTDGFSVGFFLDIRWDLCYTVETEIEFHFQIRWEYAV